jgi:hypothetical protein
MDKKEKRSQAELQCPFHVKKSKQLQEDSGSPWEKKKIMHEQVSYLL